MNEELKKLLDLDNCVNAENAELPPGIGPPEYDSIAPSLHIIVDSGVDPAKLAECLAEISSVYSELSGGDELVIKEAVVQPGLCDVVPHTWYEDIERQIRESI
jgi:hypothetical protein